MKQLELFYSGKPVKSKEINKTIYPAIKSIEFINSSILFVHLTNERACIVPLDEFPAIKKLTAGKRIV